MKYLTFLSFLLFAVSCGNGSEESKTSTSTLANDLPENLQSFALFYDKFHSDSLYQIEHITFPLEGVPVQVDSAGIMDETFRWKKADWVMHKKIDLNNSQYKRNFLSLSEMILMEKIVHQQTGFGMIRRFAKLGEDWYLIYYAGMNKLADGKS